MDAFCKILATSRNVQSQLYHAARRHPRILACALATILLGATSATVLVSDVGVAFGSMIPVMSGIQLIHNNRSALEPGVGFALVPTAIDIPSASLTLNWWPTGCNQMKPYASKSDSVTNGASWTELSAIGCGQKTESFTAWIDSNPYYSWDASNAMLRTGTSSLVSFIPQETFDTTHNFTWISVEETLAFRRQHSISAWYPFDKYTASTTLELFSSDNSSSLPIYFLHLYGGLTGHSFEIEQVEHVQTPRTDKALYIVFSIRRCIGVKIFATTLFFTNYILAAAMIWVAVCAHFGRPLPESALFLPLTNILLLPSLRSAMPGVPDFGIFMDLFGYYVNIVAIVFSAGFMFFKIIGHGRRHDRGNFNALKLDFDPERDCDQSSAGSFGPVSATPEGNGKSCC